MWIALGIILLVGWLLMKLVWNVASWGVHLLLALGALAIVVHFARSYFSGRRRAAT